jgi:hypothetical protein
VVTTLARVLSLGTLFNVLTFEIGKGRRSLSAAGNPWCAVSSFQSGNSALGALEFWTIARRTQVLR